MIAISFSGFFFLLFIILFIYMAYLWYRESAKVKRNSWHVSNSRLFHCNNCHWSFVPKKPVSLCRCPRCNTVCIRHRSDMMIDNRGQDNIK